MVLGVTMATKPHTVYESANICINYFIILCSSKIEADLSFVNFWIESQVITLRW